MDVVNRRALEWWLSIDMETDFCVVALPEAMDRHGQPEILNVDQGVQFTSSYWPGWVGRTDRSCTGYSGFLGSDRSFARTGIFWLVMMSAFVTTFGRSGPPIEDGGCWIVPSSAEAIELLPCVTARWLCANPRLPRRAIRRSAAKRTGWDCTVVGLKLPDDILGKKALEPGRAGR